MRKSADSEENTSPNTPDEVDATKKSEHSAEGGDPFYHELQAEELTEEEKREQREFRKQLNREFRGIAAGSIHRDVKLIAHRPDFELPDIEEYARLSSGLMPIVREIARKTLPLLEHESSAEYLRNKYYGHKFQADSVVHRDFRTFAKKRPPDDSPSLVVGLRVDESASMSAFGRLEAAKRAVIAVYEFCRMCSIPVSIHGDTADVSRLEQMSVYTYADYRKPDDRDRFRLMQIRARSNNRDGLALNILADRLARAPQTAKLLISLSDGQPKAMPDYTGSYARDDMQRTIAHYERKGVSILAAAIGQDKEIISQIYGSDKFLDITDLNMLPVKLVQVIARYL